MIEFGIYGLIVASTVLLSLNVMSVSFHFRRNEKFGLLKNYFLL